MTLRRIDPATLNQGIPRTSAAEEIAQKFRMGVAHVHLFGPPGFGKLDCIKLVEADRARIIRADMRDMRWANERPLGYLFRCIAPLEAEPDIEWPTEATEEWQRVTQAVNADAGVRPLIIVTDAELLLADRYFTSWPGELLEATDILTVSVAPLHLLTETSQMEAAQCSVRLCCFPRVQNQNDFLDVGSGTREGAQDLAAFKADGEAWFAEFKKGQGTEAQVDTEELQKVFDGKHLRRGYELWDGHPYVDTALLEHLLRERSLGVKQLKPIVAGFADELGRVSTNTPLRQRLLLGEVDGESLSPTLFQKISSALLKCCDGRNLDADEMAWAEASGLVKGRSAEPNWAWTRAATLVHPEPADDQNHRAMHKYATGLETSAHDREIILEDARIEHDPSFPEIRALVEEALCQTEEGRRLNRRIDNALGRCKSIVPGKIYQLRLLHERPADERTEKASGSSPTRKEPIPVSILVFEIDSRGTDLESLKYLNHHIRALKLLGRMRHPALPGFGRGGLLQSPTHSTHDRAYIEVADKGDEVLTHQRLANLLEWLNNVPADKKGVARPPHAGLSQVVRLAEAVRLLHMSGIIHRLLDFDSLILDAKGNLVVTGFEQAVFVRPALNDGVRGDRTIHSPIRCENLACAAPEVMFSRETAIDTAVDVYGFGALAIMILTGLPGSQTQHAANQKKMELKGAEFSRSDELKWEIAHILNKDFDSDRRWANCTAPDTDKVRELLRKCLDHVPRKRPLMQEVAAKLANILATTQRPAEQQSETPRYAVAFDARTMGDMLKKFKPPLIPDYVDPDSPEGIATVQGYINSWLADARWLHFSRHGFPRPGESQAETVRKESQFVLVGGGVAFYAGPYRKGGTGDRDRRFLWLGYAMRASELGIEIPGDVDDLQAQRTTTEAQKLIDLKGGVRAFPVSDIEIEYRNGDFETWDVPTLDAAKAIERAGHDLEMGEEAALAWRTHQDYQRALDMLRTFPVKLTRKNPKGHIYDMELDVSQFWQWIDGGNLLFFRQVLMEKRNAKAFFEAELTADRDQDGFTGGGVRIGPRKGRGRGKWLSGRVVSFGANEGGEGLVRVEIAKDDQNKTVPSQAKVHLSSIIGTEVALARQSAAIAKLERKTDLMSFLIRPRDSGTIRPPVSPKCGRSLGLSEEDRLELAKRVQILLASDPLAAVQGPPGTGKTTLQAALIDEVLSWQDGTRILVTSQSHAATDNILRAVEKVVGEQSSIDGDQVGSDGRHDKIDAIRLFSVSSEDRVDAEVRQKYSLESQVRNLLRTVREKGRAGEDPGNVSPSLRKAKANLRQVTHFELQARQERAAPLVFATTSASSDASEIMHERMLNYDIGIIDEAAKAFALDLVVPMSLVDRVIAVGDPEQLPPHGETDLEDFLFRAQRRIEDHPDVPANVFRLLNSVSETESCEPPFKRMNGWLRLFHRILEKAPPEKSSDDPGRIPMSQKLTKQFRSVETIGRLVSETFYNGDIRSCGPKPNRKMRISIPVGVHDAEFRPPVVWIDTSDLDQRVYDQVTLGAGRIHNQGELNLLTRLLDAGPIPQDSDDPAIRILSPYKEQVTRILRHYESNPGALAGVENAGLPALISSIDASQGSERHVVVVSMVRRAWSLFDRHQKSLERLPETGTLSDNHIEQIDRALRQVIGFMSAPERLNVMFSRARQQLVIIGDIEYFRAAARLLRRRYKQTPNLDRETLERLTFWDRLLDRFEHFDQTMHLDADCSETSVIVPAQFILDDKDGH